MSAQLEDGYTRTANELLERLMKIKLNGTQHNIIYCIIRNTYGFQRKSHAMSLTFISVAIEAHKDLVKRELDKLIECKIVKVYKDGDYTHSREVGINKNVSDWVVHSKPIGRQSTKQSTVGESVDQQSPNQSTPTVDQSVYQERKSFKEIKDIQEEEKKMTAMDAYFYSFKKWNYTGQIQGYISELMKRGFTDAFVREVFLAMGEYGASPDVNYMRKTAEDWISNGIYTLSAAKLKREEDKKKLSAVNQPSKTKSPEEAIPNPEILRMLREAN
jgi:phage replication O-like protein O